MVEVKGEKVGEGRGGMVGEGGEEVEKENGRKCKVGEEAVGKKRGREREVGKQLLAKTREEMGRNGWTGEGNGKRNGELITPFPFLAPFQTVKLELQQNGLDRGKWGKKW